MSTSEMPGELRRRWGAPRFGYAANRLMLWLGERALWAGYVGVWAAAIYFFVCVGRARRASGAYLDRVRGRRGFLRRWRETYVHMATFGMLLMDRAVMLSGPRGQRGFEMRCEGLEHVRAALERGRGVVMLTAHFGISEAAAPYMAKVGMLESRRMHLVMYREEADATERFHSEFRRMLSGVKIISTTDSLGAGLKIMAALKAGDVVGIRGDRAIGGRTVGAELLGGQVELPAGAFVAAALAGAAVVSVYTYRRGYRKYECVISPMGVFDEETGGTQEERVGRAAREYAAFLEGMLKCWPMQWSNFYDFWATNKGTTNYTN